MKKTLLAWGAAMMMGLASCSGTSSSSASAPASSEPEPSSEPSSLNSYIAPDYTPSWPQSWGLKLRQPTNEVASDFAYGVDCSSVIEVEKGGSKYYGPDGKEKELFQLMADGGANFARIRLWNNPYDTEGNRYGGGTNDLETDIEIAKRATKAGLKILIDFHYSDHWVDPGKFYSPKAWSGLDYKKKVEAMTQFTKDSMQAFADAGVEVHAVQIGNEINPGIAGVPKSNYMRIGEMISKSAAAAKEVFPDVKTIVHYTNVNNPAIIFTWLSSLQKNKALPDVVGLSYYPYWHGGLDNLQEVMNRIATDYNTEVMVVETSWGNTDESAGDYYCNNQFNSSTLGEAGGYATSTQAQATVVADIVDALSKVPNKKGTGIFYWEPAWLPNEYCGWTTLEGAYYNDTGLDWAARGMTQADLVAKYGNSYGWSSWANQGWFDYEGHSLDSLYTYRHLQEKDAFVEEKNTDLYAKELDLALNLSVDWKLPETVRATSNLGAYRNVPVTWNEEDVAKISTPGYYTVKGQAVGQEVTLNIRAEKNFIKDPDFELQGCTTEAAIDQTHWKMDTTTVYKSDIGDAHIEAKSEMGGAGNQYLHWYANAGFEFTLSQNLGQVPAGEYNFGFDLMASYYDGEASAAKYETCELVVTIGGVDTTFDILHSFQGYGAGIVNVDRSPVVLDEEAEVSIAFHVKGGAGGWGHADNFYFAAVIAD